MLCANNSFAFFEGKKVSHYYQIYQIVRFHLILGAKISFWVQQYRHYTFWTPTLKRNLLFFYSQYTTKDGELKAQLHSAGTFLPTVQMHLILCTTFTSTANKHEFLTLAYQLIDRLTALSHLTYPLR